MLLLQCRRGGVGAAGVGAAAIQAAAERAGSAAAPLLIGPALARARVVAVPAGFRLLRAFPCFGLAGDSLWPAVFRLAGLVPIFRSVFLPCLFVIFFV